LAFSFLADPILPLDRSTARPLDRSTIPTIVPPSLLSGFLDFYASGRVEGER
jgi:hypothetical protein